jgi:hypothetical protein
LIEGYQNKKALSLASSADTLIGRALLIFGSGDREA